MRSKPKKQRGQLRLLTLLRFHLDRIGHRSGAHRCERLHAHRVNGMRRQFRDGGQLAVVDHLGVPGGLRLIRIGGEEDFVALCCGNSQTARNTNRT